MVDTRALLGLIYSHGYTVTSFAKKLGMKQSALSRRMASRKFNTTEMYAIKDALKMNNKTAMQIFFADEVAQESTEVM